MRAREEERYPIVIREEEGSGSGKLEPLAVYLPKGWKAHPGIEVARVSARTMRTLGVGPTGKSSGISAVMKVDGRPQRVVLVGPEAGPELMAHEIGHAHLKHKGVSNVKEYINNELEAWDFAETRRGKRLVTSWLSKVAFNALRRYDSTPQEVGSLICSKLASMGYTPDREYRSGLIRFLRKHRKK